jgi:hypothetical protein
MLVQSDRAPKTQVVSVSLVRFNDVVDRRLAIAEIGLAEARQHLAAGQTDDVDVILEKLDEDLRLLRRRLRQESATTGSHRCRDYDCAN